MPRFDAVVVGAGPGGSAAATHLARGGARVLLVDRADFPRDKACGGGLTPRGVGALQKLGVDLGEDRALRVGGLRMVGDTRSVAVGFPSTRHWPSHALVGRRSVMDTAIFDAAVASGAEPRTHASVLGPLFEDGICRGVRVKSNGSTEDVEATWTIAADGANSAVARAAGLAPRSARSGGGFWYAAMRAYFAPVAPLAHDGEPVLEFYPLQTPSGRWLPAYGWLFPLPDGSANVGVDLPHSPRLEACPPLRQAFDEFIARMRREREGFAEAEMEAPPQGALLPEAMRGFSSGAPGLLAVGDAAGLITPYSGEGILYALESADLAAGAVLGGRRPTEAVAAYERALKDGYGFQLSAAFWIMKAMRRPALAGAAAALGMRSRRLLAAAVRVMAYLIEDDPDTTSTVSKAHRRLRRLWPS